MTSTLILWEGLYWRGHEAARLVEGKHGSRLHYHYKKLGRG